jgi:hypothetical protein
MLISISKSSAFEIRHQVTALIDIGKRLGTLTAAVCSIYTLIITAAILG